MDVASILHDQYGLPDVEQLLRDLNDARKAKAYGDIEGPDLNAAQTAIRIEEYVEAVTVLVEADN